MNLFSFLFLYMNQHGLYLAMHDVSYLYLSLLERKMPQFKMSEGTTVCRHLVEYQQFALSVNIIVFLY